MKPLSPRQAQYLVRIAKHGDSPSMLAGTIASLVKRGLIYHAGVGYRVTAAGQIVADSLDVDR